ncbi:MAG: hypothetical protein EPO20_24910 [Betaproteobacteria bacterium]|nr:MAG: hypothetical protein EPO20_24910 [Betaproteobacteria bacterium]
MRAALSRAIHGMTSENGARDLDSALERLRSPDYGVCEVCEGDVPFVRLLDDPLACVCGRCQATS